MVRLLPQPGQIVADGAGVGMIRAEFGGEDG